jgi:uncharacterized membrane protein HdeD (DUF308 family)
MSSTMPIERLPRSPLRHELEALRGSWIYFLVAGIALVVLGTIAIGSSILATFTAMVFYGVLMLMGGGVQVASAFWARDWSGVFVSLLEGLLFLVIGLFFVRDPGDAAAAMTLVIAAFLMVSGLFRIISAISHQFHHWVYALIGGVLNLVLGMIIYAQWPLSGLWVIGLFIGIEMVFSGWTWIILSLSLRKVGRHIQHAH